MTAGRNPSWNPIAGFQTAVWTEVVILSSKDRLSLPAAARRRLSWVPATSTSVVAISEFGGSAEIRPWVELGEQEIQKVAGIIAGMAEPRRSQMALAAMDRYIRLTLDVDGRMVLPTTLLSHLEAVTDPLVRIVVRNDRLWLWSESRWRWEQASRLEALEAELR